MRRSFPLNHLKRHQVWKKWDLWYKASLQGWDGVIPGLWYQTEICQRLLKQGRAFIEIPEQQFIDLVDYQPADESKWLSLSWFAKASPAAPDVPSLLLVASPTQHCYSASADALCKVYPELQYAHKHARSHLLLSSHQPRPLVSHQDTGSITLHLSSLLITTCTGLVRSKQTLFCWNFTRVPSSSSSPQSS